MILLLLEDSDELMFSHFKIRVRCFLVLCFRLQMKLDVDKYKKTVLLTVLLLLMVFNFLCDLQWIMRRKQNKRKFDL